MIEIILNPIAGNGRSKNICKEVCALLDQRGVDYCLHETQRPLHAMELAHDAALRHTHTVLSIGGDGTAYEIACGLMNTSTSLGIIPAGTGNDFIKAVGCPKNPLQALVFILTHEPRCIDIGFLNDKLFLNCCGVGFDVMVLEYSIKAKRYFHGLLPYLYGVLRTIFTYKPVHISYTLDSGEIVEESVLLFCIANGRFFGGGIPIAPTARLDDGLFDVVIVEAIPRWKIPYYLPGLMRGKIASYPITRHILCKDIRLSASSGKMNVDGEILPLDKATFSVSQTSLRLIW